MQNKKEHLNYLDGIRTVAALAVMFGHMFYSAIDGHVFKIGKAFLYAECGHEAVIAFIVLSGFCLTLPVLKHGELQGGAMVFLKRRAWRILPPYYASIALSLLLIWLVIGHTSNTQWGMSVPVTMKGLLCNIFLVQDVFNAAQINYPLWSVALEFKLYLLFPLMVFGWKRYGFNRTFWAFTAISAVLSIAVHDTVYFHSLPHFIILFMLGAWAARKTQEPARLKSIWIPLALLATSFIWARHTLDRAHDWSIGPTDVLFGAGAATLMLVLAHQSKHPVRRFFELKPLVAIGGFSYSLYLIHAPLIEVCLQRFIGPLGKLLLNCYEIMLDSNQWFLVLVAIGTPLILLWAYVFHHYIEKPSLAAAHRVTKKSVYITPIEKPLLGIIPIDGPATVPPPPPA